MSKFEKSMEKVFDVPAKVVSDEQPVTQIQPKPKIDPIEYDLDEDYAESRETLKQLVRKGNDAIDHLLAIATDTEHPRAFEVVATLIKNTAEANEKLLAMQKPYSSRYTCQNHKFLFADYPLLKWHKGFEKIYPY